MLELRKVAITGGISSGKSLVCRYLKEMGSYVADADEIVHQLLTPETDLGKQTIALLGSDVVVKGKIDRGRVAKRVFANPKLLRSLENLLHPTVYEKIENAFIEQQQKHPETPLFAAEVPLLFETGGEVFFDYTIAVVADREKCWERYRNATGYEREDFNRRMARQLGDSEKAQRADFVIHNEGTPEQLKQQVKSLFDKLRV